MQRVSFQLGAFEGVGSQSIFHHHHHKHPKLRKYALIAGVGALTGGIGGVILGTGVIHGAAMGAGSHVAFHKAKEKYQEHKNKKHIQIAQTQNVSKKQSEKADKIH